MLRAGRGLLCRVPAVCRSFRLPTPGLLLSGGIALGALSGHYLPAVGRQLGEHVDATVLALITLLFFGVRIGALVRALGALRFIAVVVATNFVLVPSVGYGIARLFLAPHPPLLIGLAIYFMAPCTDWFLGFTRLAKGNVALGAALIPINMVLQLLLYPVYLHLFTASLVQVDEGLIVGTLLQGFMAPLAAAMLMHQLLRRVLGPPRFERLLRVTQALAPWLIALLALQVFAGNIAVIVRHSAYFAWLLVAVFVFFVLTFLATEGIGRLCRFAHPEHALFAMTTAARNAPLMLAVTMAALPGQPLVYAAIVIGMVLEFPHLTVLQRMLCHVPRARRRQQKQRHSC